MSPTKNTMEEERMNINTLPVSAAVAAPQDEDVIDLLDLFWMLIDHIYAIVFCVLLGAVLLNAYAYFRIHPTYQSTAKMYMVNASDDSVVNLADLNLGASLTRDYEELMMSYPVLDQVIDKLDLEITSKQLANLISITNPKDTRILAVTATTTNPELSRDIANTMVEVAIAYLPKTMSTEEPNIAQEARTNPQKVGPSYSKYTIMGGMIGAILCCGVLLLIYLMDDTIRSADDMEKYFGVQPITVIPDMEGVQSSKKNSKKSSRKHTTNKGKGRK